MRANGHQLTGIGPGFATDERQQPTKAQVVSICVAEKRMVAVKRRQMNEIVMMIVLNRQMR